jgi:hypothetical protein
MNLGGLPAEFGRDIGSSNMRFLVLVLTLGGATLLAGCRMRTDETGVTPTSSGASSETGGRANADSSFKPDAEETMSPGELEKELDQIVNRASGATGAELLAQGSAP